MTFSKYKRPLNATILVVVGIILSIKLCRPYFLATSGYNWTEPQQLYMKILFAIVGAFLGFIAEQYLHHLLQRSAKISSSDKVVYLLGFMLGILLASAFRFAMGEVRLPFYVNIIIALILIGISTYALRSAMDQWASMASGPKTVINEKPNIKFLDTNVIIDGRIADLFRTGFIEGQIVVPKFILIELQTISDSSDPLKRAKGRRGLEILNALQKEFNLTVKETPLDAMRLEIDSKLVTCAIDAGATIITNDYNLNKVAALQNVKTLNINELAIALRPQVMPGEVLNTAIIKQGKEKSQGLAYMDDGTMIVVENGAPYIGKVVKAEVSSYHQTAQGKMIFAKVAEPYEKSGSANSRGRH
ncbi:MAG: TRAM domain-containing protein [Abditibacteriota bacterium]|nr:TRAM domain-containing protein [Abditibacteriota bacterium]